MRARNLKPGFFKSEKVGDCSFASRLLYQGLWCMADREGKLEDRPKKMRAEIFPYDDIEIEPLLRQLAAQGLIVRYQAQGLELIWIPKFSKHQNPHRNESPSMLPSCREDEKTCDHGHKRLLPWSQALGLNPDLGILNPDLGILNPESEPLTVDLEFLKSKVINPEPASPRSLERGCALEENKAPAKLPVKAQPVKAPAKSPPLAPGKKRLGTFANVKLSAQELGRLHAAYGQDKTSAAIEKLSSYLASKGAKYKSHYAAMLSWVLKAVDEDMGQGRGSPQQGQSEFANRNYPKGAKLL